MIAGQMHSLQVRSKCLQIHFKCTASAPHMCYKCAANALSALHYALAASAFQMHCKYTSNALQVRRTCATSVPQVRCEFAARAHHVSALLEHAGTQLAARLPRVRAWGRHGRRRVLKRSGRACPPLSLSCVLHLGRQAYTSQAPCNQPAPSNVISVRHSE